LPENKKPEVVVMPTQAATREKIMVQVLHTEGCANTAPAIGLIEAVAAELAMGIELSDLAINTPEQARAHTFYGSPTVQVNGRDIEVAVRGNQAAGLT
jgi:hypothetical protein